MNDLATAPQNPQRRRKISRRVRSRISASASRLSVLSMVAFLGLVQTAVAAPAANAAVGAPTAIAAPPELQVVTFRCTGDPQYFSVPPGVDTVSVFAQGAAGADPQPRIGAPPAGAAPGYGAVVEVQMPVTQGQLYTVNVGCRTGYGWAKGGAGGSANGSVRHGASGGGASGVTLNGSPEPRAVGGGGGGGGGNSAVSILKGGVGGSAGPKPEDGASGDPVGVAGGLGGPAGGSPITDGSDGGSSDGFPATGGGGGGGGGGYVLSGRGGQGGNLPAGSSSGGGGGGGGAGFSFAASHLRSTITTAGTLEDGIVTFIYHGPASGSQTFGCTGKPVPYVVPVGVTSLDVVAVGGQGGPPLNLIGSNPFGGRGDVHRARIAVTAGETLQIVVGCAGGAGTQSWCGGSGGAGGFGLISGGPGGSGVGGCIAPPAGDGGSGGGGASGVASQFPPDDVNDVLLMAAGGGAGGGLTFTQAGGTGAGYGPYQADEISLPQTPGASGGGACGGSGGAIGSNSSILGAIGGTGGNAADASAGGGGGGGGGGFPVGLGGGGGGFAYCGGGGGAAGGSRFGLGVTPDKVGPYRVFGNGDGMVTISPIFKAPDDLAVTATATAALTRTTTWGIIKGASSVRPNIPAGESAIVNYHVQVNHDSGIDGDWTVTGHVTVTNANGSAVTGVNVTAATDNGGSCSVPDGTGVTIPAHNSVALAYTCAYATRPVLYIGTLTAAATWPSFGSPNTRATAPAGFDFATATPTLKDGTVRVTDSVAGVLGTVRSDDPSSTRFSYAKSYPGRAGTCTDYPNTATYTTDSGKTGSSSFTVKVCVGADLNVSTTATPTVPHINWGITKHVDKTVVKQTGGKATFKYTVVVKQAGLSGWQVSGKISVTNPNDWEPITGTVTDTVDNGGVCTVAGGVNITVEAGGTTHLPYTCTYATAPNPAAGTNRATVTWDKAVAATPVDSAHGAHGFVFDAGTSADHTVRVTDTFDGATTTLGTVTGRTIPPYASKTFTYERKVAVPTSGCRTFANTAAIAETGQTADASVRVCRR